MRRENKQKNTVKDPAKDPVSFSSIQEEKNPPAMIDTETEPPYKIYNDNIYSYIDDFIESEFAGYTEEDLKQNKSFFPLLVQYIYNNYLCHVFKNGLDYKLKGIKPIYDDIGLIDNIFNIYIDIVYRYKWNNRPSILEFSIITGISRDTIYSWINGNNIDNNIIGSSSDDKRKHITIDYTHTAQKWQGICEQSLVDGNGEMIKEIFLLKAKHGYRDNNNDIQITVNHKQIIDADTLPALIGINSKD